MSVKKHLDRSAICVSTNYAPSTESASDPSIAQTPQSDEISGFPAQTPPLDSDTPDLDLREISYVCPENPSTPLDIKMLVRDRIFTAYSAYFKNLFERLNAIPLKEEQKTRFSAILEKAMQKVMDEFEFLVDCKNEDSINIVIGINEKMETLFELLFPALEFFRSLPTLIDEQEFQIRKLTQIVNENEKRRQELFSCLERSEEEENIDIENLQRQIADISETIEKRKQRLSNKKKKLPILEREISSFLDCDFENMNDFFQKLRALAQFLEKNGFLENNREFLKNFKNITNGNFRENAEHYRVSLPLSFEKQKLRYEPMKRGKIEYSYYKRLQAKLLVITMLFIMLGLYHRYYKSGGNEKIAEAQDQKTLNPVKYENFEFQFNAAKDLLSMNGYEEADLSDAIKYHMEEVFKVINPPKEDARLFVEILPPASSDEEDPMEQNRDTLTLTSADLWDFRFTQKLYEHFREESGIKITHSGFERGLKDYYFSALAVFSFYAKKGENHARLMDFIEHFPELKNIPLEPTNPQKDRREPVEFFDVLKTIIYSETWREYLHENPDFFKNLYDLLVASNKKPYSMDEIFELCEPNFREWFLEKKAFKSPEKSETRVFALFDKKFYIFSVMAFDIKKDSEQTLNLYSGEIELKISYIKDGEQKEFSHIVKPDGRAIFYIDALEILNRQIIDYDKILYFDIHLDGEKVEKVLWEAKEQKKQETKEKIYLLLPFTYAPPPPAQIPEQASDEAKIEGITAIVLELIKAKMSETKEKLFTDKEKGEDGLFEIDVMLDHVKVTTRDYTEEILEVEEVELYDVDTNSFKNAVRFKVRRRAFARIEIGGKSYKLHSKEKVPVEVDTYYIKTL